MKLGVLTLKYPVEHGIVTYYDDVEKLLHCTMCNLWRAAPDEHPVLLTAPPNASRAQFEETSQLWFDTLIDESGPVDSRPSSDRRRRLLDEHHGTTMLMGVKVVDLLAPYAKLARSAHWRHRCHQYSRDHGVDPQYRLETWWIQCFDGVGERPCEGNDVYHEIMASDVIKKEGQDDPLFF